MKQIYVDWKDFLIANKWAQPRTLTAIFPDFKSHDLTNWLKIDSVRKVLDRESWKLGEGLSPDNTKRTLYAMWEYYLIEENEFELDDPEIIFKLISHRLNPDSTIANSIFSTRYLKKLSPPIENWLSRGFTVFSYAITHIYPGQKWCDRNFLIPAMFQQSRVDMSLEDTLNLMELIWLRHIRKLSAEATLEQITNAKEAFYARHSEASFITSADWRRYGVTSQMVANSHNRFSKLLAERFANDLGIENENILDKSWNSSKFKRENLSVQFQKCRYSGTTPADLHHLLDRAKWPELTYHPENVVPIAPDIHALITRRKWPDEIAKAYEQAQRAWLKAPDGQKVNVFDGVMQAIFNYARGGHSYFRTLESPRTPLGN